MTKQIRLHKGLDIKLKGRAKETTMPQELSSVYGLVPDDFVGIIPRLKVKPGDHVKAGETLFVNKNSEEVGFASPVIALRSVYHSRHKTQGNIRISAKR